MKAKVTQDFEYEGRKFNKDEIYPVKEMSYYATKTYGVFVGDKWFCDVDSPIFEGNFILLENQN